MKTKILPLLVIFLVVACNKGKNSAGGGESTSSSSPAIAVNADEPKDEVKDEVIDDLDKVETEEASDEALFCQTNQLYSMDMEVKENFLDENGKKIKKTKGKKEFSVYFQDGLEVEKDQVDPARPNCEVTMVIKKKLLAAKKKEKPYHIKYSISPEQAGIPQDGDKVLCSEAPVAEPKIKGGHGYFHSIKCSSGAKGDVKVADVRAAAGDLIKVTEYVK